MALKNNFTFYYFLQLLLNLFLCFFRLQDLYREIVSQARVVGACIRASDKLTKVDRCVENKSTTNSTTGSDGNRDDGDRVDIRRIDNNSKALERRYHLLYLKAIEIQCMFEGLLGKKDSASVSFLFCDWFDYIYVLISRCKCSGRKYLIFYFVFFRNFPCVQI